MRRASIFGFYRFLFLLVRVRRIVRVAGDRVRFQFLVELHETSGGFSHVDICLERMKSHVARREIFRVVRLNNEADLDIRRRSDWNAMFAALQIHVPHHRNHVLVFRTRFVLEVGADYRTENADSRVTRQFICRSIY